MYRLVIAATFVVALVPGSANAQMRKGFRVETTRDGAIAAAVKTFKRMDTDANGSIDNAEVTAILQARAEKRGKQFKPRAATRTIKGSDGNGDGIVTLDEFKTAAGARFDAADANKNGKIDADEARGRGAAKADAGSQ